MLVVWILIEGTPHSIITSYDLSEPFQILWRVGETKVKQWLGCYSSGHFHSFGGCHEFVSLFFVLSFHTWSILKVTDTVVGWIIPLSPTHSSSQSSNSQCFVVVYSIFTSWVTSLIFVPVTVCKINILLSLCFLEGILSFWGGSQLSFCRCSSSLILW